MIRMWLEGLKLSAERKIPAEEHKDGYARRRSGSVAARARSDDVGTRSCRAAREVPQPAAQ